MDNQVKRRQKRLRVILTGVFAVVYFFVPNTLFGLGDTLWGWIKHSCLIVLIMMYITNIPHFFKGKNAGIRITLLVFCIIKLLSVIVNADFVSSLSVGAVIGGEFTTLDTGISLKQVVFNSMMILVLSLAFDNISKTGYAVRLLEIITIAMSLLVLVCNVDVLFNIAGDGKISYMFRDKFKVCYLNLFICVLYHYRHPLLKGNRKLVMMALILMLMIISLLTQCSTMLVGSIIYFCLVFLTPRVSWQIFYKKNTFLLLLLIFDVLFFFFSWWVLKFPFVQTIVVDFLHEDLTLTGRLGIYTELTQTFLERPLLGYGEGSSFIICQYFANAPDTQNGLAEIFITNGILGCIAFLAFMVFVLRRASELGFKVYPIVALIYLMTVVSMVEIPFDNEFIFFVILILLKNNIVDKCKKPPVTAL